MFRVLWLFFVFFFFANRVDDFLTSDPRSKSVRVARWQFPDLGLPASTSRSTSRRNHHWSSTGRKRYLPRFCPPVACRDSEKSEAVEGLVQTSISSSLPSFYFCRDTCRDPLSSSLRWIALFCTDFVEFLYFREKKWPKRLKWFLWKFSFRHGAPRRSTLYWRYRTSSPDLLRKKMSINGSTGYFVRWEVHTIWTLFCVFSPKMMPFFDTFSGIWSYGK